MGSTRLRDAATFSILITLAALLLSALPGANAQLSEEQNQLEVKFASNIAESYVVKVASNEKYTIDQSYSWVRDDSSRYNLLSYSLDNGNPIEIPRKARGTFSLDVPMDTDHTVIFVAVIQYPISVTIQSNFNADNVIRFNPPSPTGDNWFDTGTSVAVAVPHYIVQQEQESRRQLVAWTLDTSSVKEITIPNNLAESQSSEFSTPSIVIATSHNVGFLTKQQYYLDVISEHGTVAGDGWYDSGSEATISIKPGTISFPISYVFEGSDGMEWTDSDRYSTKVLMDAPKTVVAKWKSDYNQLLIVAVGTMVALAATGLLIGRKRGAKKNLPSPSRIAVADMNVGPSTVAAMSSSVGSSSSLRDPEDEGLSTTGGDNHQTAYGDEYARDLMRFALAKSMEILESLHAAGLVPDSRFAGTREKLDQSFA